MGSIGVCVGSIWVHIGSVRVHVWFVRFLDFFQAKHLCWGSYSMRSPKANGFAFSWNIGLTVTIDCIKYNVHKRDEYIFITQLPKGD